ncbi:MAG: phenylacetate--CoA ligase family protein [Acidobacteria bacterium]|nr:MAG: phenylacetate--CoA ligase family protein [Acidobacteriota bacterium]
MSFYDARLETLDRDALRAHQEERLRRLMAVVPRSAFYRRKLAAAGIDPASISSLDDLARLPFTTKAELLAAQRREPPFGGLTTRPPADYRYLYRTSGTSGRPLLWLDGEEDWATWLRAWGAVYRGAGVGAEDVVFGAFSFGPFISHWTAMAGAAHVGALCVPGGGMSSRQRLEAILDHRCTVLVSTPTYALHLAAVAAAEGLDLASSAVRVTIHAGEPGASVASVRRRLAAAWGARPFDHAGATEVGAWAFSCREQTLEPHLNELEFVCEVVDGASGEAVADGERGELVITTLGRPGMPVLRYRTGDLVIRSRRPCPCGRHLARIRGGVLGRADDMQVVRGVNVYPSLVDDLVRALPEVVEYRVEVDRRQALDELRIHLELAPGASFAAAERRLAAAFRSRLGLRVVILEAAAGSLPRFELKARRWVRLEAEPGS